MRTWVPWSLLVALAAVAALCGVIGVTAGGRQSSPKPAGPSHTPIGTLRSTSAEAPTTLPPQGGYRGVESFCADAPLTGAIQYDGTSGGLVGVLTVDVGGLPPDDQVVVNWSNNFIRAPVIADFQTDSNGDSMPSSVNLYRLGEVRGVEIVLTGGSGTDPVLGRLEPC